MVKNSMIEELIQKTKKSEEECTIINDILHHHFIIGKNNKKMIVNDFKEKLDLTLEEADELYNICAELVLKGIFRVD